MAKTLQQIDDAMQDLWHELQLNVAAEIEAEHEDDARSLTEAANTLSGAQHIVETVLRNRRKAAAYAEARLSQMLGEARDAA
ncbi:hypothetical protein [Geminicoccus harenae]|uniref:hypothetical protein n=1 Tax=Geminicoccus harenae TaxID=2498453 RepID=UPI00168AD854|nr:hypothetical protein [Geminicoccus harenae]